MFLPNKFSKLFHKNTVCILTRNLSNDISFKEIEIPVPWGKIAGKWWGPTDKRPIVCIHGWQDNCNTFDGLIPLLPNQSYLAFDYPGHGLSTKLPNGMFYYSLDLPIILRRIHKHFNWPQISILAHSLGASLTHIYASIYPNDIDLLISIDGTKPRSYKPGEIIDKLGRNIDNFIKYDSLNVEGKEPPAYSLKEIAQKMHEGTFESIDLDKCETLYKRNVKQSAVNPGKYYFNRDVRLKCGALIGWQHADLMEYIKRIKCPMIFIRTMRSRINEKDEYLKDAIETMTKHNPLFEYTEFDGKHHDHLNRPEDMAIVINKFLKKYDRKNRDFKNLI